MSNQYYNQKWQEGINDLVDLSQQENLPAERFESSKNKPISDQEMFHYYATLYLRYIDAYKKLEDCYDQIVHPQKRQLMKEMLENSMVRLCELKSQLVKTNTLYDYTIKSDFINLDDLIMDLKLLPDCIEVPIPRLPRYTSEDQKKILEERDYLFETNYQDVYETNMPEEEIYQEKFDNKDLQTREQALQVIFAVCERGRQGIERWMLARKLQLEEEKKKENKLKFQENIEDFGEETLQDDAALIIKKYWRGYIDRMKVQGLREQEQEFLGMKKVPEDQNKPDSIYKKMYDQRKELKEIQLKHQQEYEALTRDLQQQVLENEGPDLKEKMRKERRDWMYQKLEESNFASLPVSAEEYVEKDKVLSPEQIAEIEAKAEEASKKKGAKDAKKAAAKGGKGGKKGKLSELDEFNETHKPTGPTEAVLKLQELVEKFNKEWLQESRQLAKNPEQKCEIDLVKQEIKPDITKLMKDQVDKLINVELENLRLQHGIKKPKIKKPKNKKPKKSKKKFPGDIATKGKTPNIILGGLFEKKVIKKLMPAKLTDLMGDPNVLGCLQEKNTKEAMPDPSMLQLRQCIAEYIGIPMSSVFARERLEKMQFFLFYGPSGSGKTLAIRALATECNAIIIDISPSSIDTKFPDKKQLDGMLNSAFKTAQYYQPAIIVCDDIEMIFQGKKKKGQVQNTFYQKLKKPLMEFKKKKFLDQIDRVAFIACTNRPWEGSTKDMKNFFDKKFYFPFPNYGTRMMLFQHFIDQKKVKLPENFSLSALSHISEGFTGGSIQTCINKVLTERRILRLKEAPLTVEEFIGPLSQTYCLDQTDYNKMKTFTDEVCQFKERRDKRKNPEEENKGKTGKKGK